MNFARRHRTPACGVCEQERGTSVGADTSLKHSPRSDFAYRGYETATTYWMTSVNTVETERKLETAVSHRCAAFAAPS